MSVFAGSSRKFSRLQKLSRSWNIPIQILGILLICSAASIMHGQSACTAATDIVTPYELSSLSDSYGEHVYYEDGCGEIHQLVWNTSTNAWTDQNLTSLSSSGIVANAISPLSSFADSYGEHVYYLASNYQIHQLFLSKSTNTWVDQNLMVFADNLAITSFSDASGEHVFYTDTLVQVHQLYWNNATNVWTDQNLGSIGNVYSSFADSHGEHVYYLDSYNQVHQLYWTNSTNTWVDQNLMDLANSSGVESYQGLTSFSDASGEHIFFDRYSSENAALDGQISQLYWNSATNAWTEQYPIGVIRSSGILSSLADNYGEHVYYLGGDAQIHQLYLSNSTNTWIDQNLMGLAKSSNTTGYSATSFSDASGQHIFYIVADGGNGQIHQLYWNSATNTWADQDLGEIQ